MKTPTKQQERAGQLLLGAYGALTLIGKVFSRACYGAASAFIEPLVPDVRAPIPQQPPPAPQTVGDMPVGGGAQPEPSKWNVVATDLEPGDPIIPLRNPIEGTPTHVRLETESSQEVRHVVGVEGNRILLDCPPVHAPKQGDNIRLHYRPDNT